MCVIVHLVLCLVFSHWPHSSDAQGWKHGTVWRHKVPAQPQRVPVRKQFSLALIPCYLPSDCLLLFPLSSRYWRRHLGRMCEPKVEPEQIQLWSHKETVLRHLNTNKKGSRPSQCDERETVTLRPE